MFKLKINRRNFLKAGSTAAIGAATGATLSFAPGAQAGAGNKTIVYVFLRGAMDGLSFMPPIAGSDADHYVAARDYTLETRYGAQPLSLGQGFGIHSYCSGLRNLYNSGDLALIHSCGHPPDTLTRSHFVAQEQIELGTPGSQAPIDGWLTRYLLSSALPSGAVFSALAATSSPPISLNGFSGVATLDSPSSFSPNPRGTYESTHLKMLDKLYQGQGGMDLAVQDALATVDVVNGLDLEDYSPAGLPYPRGSFGERMQFIAQLLSDPPNAGGTPQDLKISAVTVDSGGWDDHNDLYSPFRDRIGDLSDGLAAFHSDMAARGKIDDIVVVVQTEFGRQVEENAARGTDHGLGAPMMVLGGGITGGIYGDFPGLAVSDRISDSVAPTTDFRNVLATVTDRVLGNPNLDMIFPGFMDYQPLGFA